MRDQAEKLRRVAQDTKAGDAGARGARAARSPGAAAARDPADAAGLRADLPRAQPAGAVDGLAGVTAQHS